MSGGHKDTAHAKFDAELKYASVLFFDLVDSLQIISRMDAEESSEFLRSLIDKASSIARRHGGTVSKLAGDGAMFLFGAPLSTTAHALSACRAAIDMRAIRHAIPGSTEVCNFRIGISSGEMLVEPVKTDIGWQYDANGHAVHLASRMESLATPGTIYVTQATYDLTKSDLSFTVSPPRQVKGIEEDVAVFRLDNVGSAASPFDHQYETRFIGRESELERLHAICSDPSPLSPKLTLLSGEAGVGKSRLLHEFAVSMSHQSASGAVYIKGHFNIAEPFSAIRLCVAQLTNGDGGISAEAFVESVASRHPHFDPEQSGAALRDLYEGLYESYVSTCDAEIDARADTTNRYFKNISAGFSILLKIVARTRKLLFVFDEFFEFDYGSREVIYDAIERLESKQIAVIVSVRESRSKEELFRRVENFQTLKISRLPEPEVAELTQALLAGQSCAEADVSRISTLSEGNPLFVEELANAFSYFSRRNLPALEFAQRAPVSTESAFSSPILTSLILERVDRLSPETKRVLKVASVLGELFQAPLLREVCETLNLEAQETNHLLAENFLLLAHEGNLDTLRFHHPLVREIVHRTILKRELVTFHRAAFDVLESASADTGFTQTLQKAYHADGAKLYAKAVIWHRLAGSIANKRALNRQAINNYEAAIVAAGRIENEKVRTQHVVDLLVEMRNPLYQIGDLDAVSRQLQSAKEMAQGLGNPRLLGKILVCESHASWLRGAPVDAHSSAEQAAKMAIELDDRAMGVRASFHTALSSFAMGHCKKASETLFAVVEAINAGIRCEKFGVDEALGAIAESYRARSLLEIGQRDESVRASTESLHLAQKSGDLFAQCIAGISHGIIAVATGEMAEARHHYANALKLIDRAEITLMRPVCEANYGLMLVNAGEVDAGTAMIDRSIAESLKIGLRFQSGLRYLFRSLASIAIDDFDAALRFAERAQEEARATREERTFQAAEKLLSILGDPNHSANSNSAGLMNDAASFIPFFSPQQRSDLESN